MSVKTGIKIGELRMITEKINRIKKTYPKTGRYWCYGCDRSLVWQGRKCPVCGQKAIGKHKKP